ncbi:hydroxyisourate hydrolase [Galbitalea soli]|uniref:5-hydroxyisourate hydrolase n=1 Tax=Galbitalea soli TaxID=1268042 RepID=A0A7C9PN67_9MICO|nr:hydroxyisourate hydrolase [Galbitalea soli]NEM91430.1 hydroxyisourate hydrolase [Galbitalea soli]NYJ30123.1 5-hydroxyisourate hydrolase [Galbitalea soli]
MSQLTTHVLDASLGRPASGVPVVLYTGSGEVLAGAATNADGRVPELGPDQLAPGEYRLVFDTSAYFASVGQTGFYPRVTIDFEVTEAEAHYHVPLLLSPFAYSTYRGS